MKPSFRSSFSHTGGFLFAGAIWITALLPAVMPCGAQEPAAAKETAGEQEPSRAEVEQYTGELRELISRKEENMTSLINEIRAHDKAIQAAVSKVLSLLSGAADSQRTGTRVARLKADTIAGLERAAKAYAQKRNQIAAQLREADNAYTRADLFKVRGVLDDSIGKMVDAAVGLAVSMETDEGHEKYIQGANVIVGRRGFGVHETLRNPDYGHNKREAAVSDGVRKNLSTALTESRKRLTEDLRRAGEALAEPGLTEDKKAQLSQEKERLSALLAERAGQQDDLGAAASSTAGTAGIENTKAFSSMEDIIQETAAEARRHFNRLLAAYQDLSGESARLGALKAKLDFSENWLQSHPAGK